jgi:hypothetical protein
LLDLRMNGTHCASPNIALLHLPEPVAIRICLIYLSKRDIHEIVAVHEMAIEGLPIFKFNHLTLALTTVPGSSLF